MRKCNVYPALADRPSCLTQQHTRSGKLSTRIAVKCQVLFNAANGLHEPFVLENASSRIKL